MNILILCNQNTQIQVNSEAQKVENVFENITFDTLLLSEWQDDVSCDKTNERRDAENTEEIRS